MTRSDAYTGRGRHHQHATPGVALRDRTDQELSDAVDADREHADALLHADTRWCPRCKQPTLASRQHICLFCDGLTEPGQALVATAGSGVSHAPLAGSTDRGEEPSVVTSATPQLDLTDPGAPISPAWDNQEEAA